MRMWLVPTHLLCQQHLLGEHVELHMLVGSIKRGKSLKGFVEKGLISTPQISTRHDEIVEEMVKRGMNHKSPLPYTDTLALGEVDPEVSLRDLEDRCSKCRARINGVLG